jgi:ABC-type transport system substrate-binding protein
MRRLVVASLIFALGIPGWTTSGLAQRAPTPRGELHVVDPDPLNWAWITWNVFEHLIETDQHGKLVPRLATSWRWLDERTLEMKLRQGVRFHNGESFDAEAVKLNWEQNTELRQPHIIGEYVNFKPGSRIEIVDRFTVRFLFPEPDGAALVKLALVHMGSRQFYRELGWGEKHW